MAPLRRQANAGWGSKPELLSGNVAGFTGVRKRACGKDRRNFKSKASQDHAGITAGVALRACACAADAWQTICRLPNFTFAIADYSPVRTPAKQKARMAIFMAWNLGADRAFPAGLVLM